MKKLTLFTCIFAVALLTCLVTFAQSKDIVGQWQGILQAGGAQLRIIIKVTKDEGSGAFQATFYSIDQGGAPIPVGTTSLQGSDVKFIIPGLNGTFEGTLSADSTSIKGTWSQGPTPLPLDLARATTETAWEIPPPPAPPKPMTNPDPSFEVATVKPSAPDERGFGIGVPRGGREISTINTPLMTLITFAYGVHPKQVVGAPDWINQTKWDVDGRPEGDGQPNDKQWKIMLQKLLADRFQLTYHHEKQELSVYTIVLGKGDPKLTPSGGDPNSLPGLGFAGGLGNLVVRNATMGDFAGFMQNLVLDKPAVDQTGLTTRYDFTLKWTPDQSQFEAMGGIKAPPTDDPNAPPDLYTAIQQQLNLKIDSTKAPTDVMVIDKVSQPSPN